MYSVGASEEVLGNALKAFGVKRESVVIATKVFQAMSDEVNDRGLSRKHIMDSIDRSLRRLKMGYVDLYQVHRWDYAAPIEETMEALNDVVKSGKARYIGASSMFAWQFAKAQYTADLHGWTRFVSMQNHYNLVYREEEREMIPLCIDQGIGLIPWSPMARGFFAGNRKSGGGGETVRAKTDPFADSLYFREEDFTVAERTWEVAKAHNASGPQIALAWMLNKPHITAPIIGASKMEHLDQSIAALEIKLAPEEIKHLEELYQPHPVLGHS
jgi:aryl-alcohol dehydrogenase (NADP+)